MANKEIMNREGSLWMGDIENYMTEDFIKQAFELMGEECISIKIMKNKVSDLPAGYCFIQFKDDQTAVSVMHRLNGKVVPNSQPPIRFKLNHASATAKQGVEKEYSLWVGDLSGEVDDNQLYKVFATRYNSVRTAKDASGFSRGYAFVRFANEAEHADALTTMNGFKGLGTKAIKVSLAVPKSQLSTLNEINTSYSQQYYEQYWQNYAAWQGYYDQNSYYTGYTSDQNGAYVGYEEPSEDDFKLIEHDTPVDVDALNRELITRSEEFWDALDHSRWLPPDALESHPPPPLPARTT